MPSRLKIYAILFTFVMVMGSSVAAVARPLSPPWEAKTPFSSETAIVSIDGHVVDAELADTGPLRERGLSYREGLASGTGMLFVYGDAANRGFWMFEMRFCLDIIWITDGRVVGAAENSCPAENPGDEIPKFRSPEAVQYVLEVDAGWLAAHDVSEGSTVEIELPPSVAIES